MQKKNYIEKIMPCDVFEMWLNIESNQETENI